MEIFYGYIILSDIDGTFECNEFKCPQINVDAIEYFTKNGGKFAFATGRMSDYIKARGFDALTNAPCCLCNGAFVYDTDTDEVLYQKTVPHTVIELAEHIIPYANGLTKFITPIGTTTEHHTAIDINNPPENVRDKYPSKQVNVFETRELAIEFENAIKADQFFDDCFICRSWEVGVEILNKNATKGEALKFIKDYCGCHTAVAIGDFGNDLPMLLAADIAVAVDSDYEGLKQIADMVVCKCTDGAIADLIYKLEEKIKSNR